MGAMARCEALQRTYRRLGWALAAQHAHVGGDGDNLIWRPAGKRKERDPSDRLGKIRFWVRKRQELERRPLCL